MKLVVPLAGIVIGSGICCCCGGGDMTEMLNGMKSKVEEEVTAAQGGTTTTTVTDGTGTVTTTNGGITATSEGATTAVGSIAGLCGRFATMGIQAPAGFSIMVCSDGGAGSASLILTGSGDPTEVCKPFKGWITQQGYDIQADVGFGGTYSITSRKGAENLAVACTNATGPTLITIAVSQ